MAKAKNADKNGLQQLDTREERRKALEEVIAQVEKQYGPGSLMRLGQNKTMNVDVIPTGSLCLDIALGVGGVPKGRIVEIYGPESSGKTTVALQMVAQAQKAGGEAAFIDVEHALDPVYAKALGVDIDSLLVSQPSTGEEALEITEALVRSNALSIIVIDSVAAMATKAEIEGDMGDSHVGLQARLMSQAMRKLTGIIGKTNCLAILKQRLAAVHSSILRPSVLMYAKGKRLRTAMSLSAMSPAARSSKIRLHLRLRSARLTCCSAKELPAKVN